MARLVINKAPATPLGYEAARLAGGRDISSSPSKNLLPIKDLPIPPKQKAPTKAGAFHTTGAGNRSRTCISSQSRVCRSSDISGSDHPVQTLLKYLTIFNVELNFVVG